jgi:hypothetical protein
MGEGGRGKGLYYTGTSISEVKMLCSVKRLNFAQWKKHFSHFCHSPEMSFTVSQIKCQLSKQFLNLPKVKDFNDGGKMSQGQLLEMQLLESRLLDTFFET